jgi:hypothetical protein
MADYDENGWKNPAWLDPDDVSAFGASARAAE